MFRQLQFLPGVVIYSKMCKAVKVFIFFDMLFVQDWECVYKLKSCIQNKIYAKNELSYAFK